MIGATLLDGDLIALPGGTFEMGSDARYGNPADVEGPVRPVHVGPFAISRHAVTNARFAAFASATGHRTEAEHCGWSFVFGGLLPDDFPPTRAVAAAPWWRQVEGAAWSRPEGPHSSLQGRGNHPVVHVSHDDALAFCAWSATRLPTEAEWEYAARGGIAGQPFPWGRELTPGGEHRMNVFQGRFPGENTCEDGWAGTAPVDAYAPNAFGLFNVCGNVWEWTADRWSPGGARVMRGGSYLCHASYCNRYRVDARSSNEPDASTGNLGFRVARSPG